MPERDELDRWGVPKALRAKIFQFGLIGLSAALVYVFVYYNGKLELCNEGWRKDTERFLNQVADVAKERASEVTKEKIQTADNQFTKRTDSVANDIKSLEARLHALQKQTQ